MTDEDVATQELGMLRIVCPATMLTSPEARLAALFYPEVYLHQARVAQHTLAFELYMASLHAVRETERLEVVAGLCEDCLYRQMVRDCRPSDVRSLGELLVSDLSAARTARGERQLTWLEYRMAGVAKVLGTQGIVVEAGIEEEKR